MQTPELRQVGRLCGNRFCWWDEPEQCWRSECVDDAWGLLHRAQMIFYPQKLKVSGIASDIRYQALFDGGKEVTIVAMVE